MPELVFTPYYPYWYQETDGFPYGYFGRNMNNDPVGHWVTPKKGHLIYAKHPKIGVPLGLLYQDGHIEDISFSEREILLPELVYLDTPQDFVNMVLHYRKTGRIKHGLGHCLSKPLRPVFGRYPENPNRDTFDYIHAEIPIKSNIPNRDQLIQERYKDIAKVVADDLARRRDYLKYGIPINCLRVTDCTKRKCGTLAFTFEFKEV